MPPPWVWALRSHEKFTRGSDCHSESPPRPPALPEAWVPANAGTHAEPLFFYKLMLVFLCSVAAVLLLLLLPLLVSPVNTLKKKWKATVCGLEVAEPVCVPPAPCQTAAALYTTAAVPQFLVGPSAASAPATAAAIID